MRKSILASAALITLLLSGTASAETFPAGSLIIPMDTDHQDEGMFKAYGLVYQLLLHDVPVRWTIRFGKNFGRLHPFGLATDAPQAEAALAHFIETGLPAFRTAGADGISASG